MSQHLIRKSFNPTAILAALILAGAAASATAATQGTAGDTSKGEFTVTIGNNAVGAKVRVFGLSDMNFPPNSANVPTPWGNLPGVADGFCVAHSRGGAVKLTFSSPGITAAQGENLIAKSPVTGAKQIYHLDLQAAGNGAWTRINLSGDKTFTIAATQSNMDTCSTPNVKKTILLSYGAQPSKTDVFTDVVTITATPI